MSGTDPFEEVMRRLDELQRRIESLPDDEAEELAKRAVPILERRLLAIRAAAQDLAVEMAIAEFEKGDRP